MNSILQTIRTCSIGMVTAVGVKSKVHVATSRTLSIVSKSYPGRTRTKIRVILAGYMQNSVRRGIVSRLRGPSWELLPACLWLRGWLCRTIGYLARAPSLGSFQGNSERDQGVSPCFSSGIVPGYLTVTAHVHDKI